MAERLARAGLVTLTIDYGLDGGLPADLLAGRDEAVLLGQVFGLGSQPLLGALVEDALGALDWLRQHPDTDPDRIGLHAALAAGDPAIRDIVNAAGETFGLAIATLVNILNPDALRTAGGTLGYPGYWDTALATARAHSLPELMGRLHCRTHPGPGTGSRPGRPPPGLRVGDRQGLDRPVPLTALSGCRRTVMAGVIDRELDHNHAHASQIGDKSRSLRWVVRAVAGAALSFCRCRRRTR